MLDAPQNQCDVVVQIIRHATTGLFVARSDDLPTMFAHGRSEEEVTTNVVHAISAIYEAQGNQHVEVLRTGEPTRTFDKISVSYSVAA